MIIKLLLGLALIFLLFKAINSYKKLPTDKKKAFLFKCLMFGGAAVLLIGVVSGRMHWFGAVIAAILPLLRFGAGTLTKVVPFWLHRTGGKAPIKTQFLDVKVTVTSGTITGRVLQGPYEGKAVEELTDEELAELEMHYKDQDAKSYYLIKFARKALSGREQKQQPPPSFGAPSREEALQTLGLTGSPSREEIVQAHRRLINRLHPDRGGSDFLAARVNQARDILLK